MQNRHIQRVVLTSGFVLSSIMMLACGQQPITNTTTNRANTNSNTANTATAPANTSNSNVAAASPVEPTEPGTYQATVTATLEAFGEGIKTPFPSLSAVVSRSGDDRRMEFTMPAGGRIVFLDKGGKNYLMLPEKNQYAELSRESLGFDIRRMLMPEQIVAQVKNVKGLEMVGAETYNGRDAVKYRYAATADTNTKAGQVATESFLIVDKATGLPLRSETVTRAAAGNTGYRYNGLKVVTEITDLKAEASAENFVVPADFQKVDSQQVRAQVDMIFSSLSAVVTQLMKQAGAQ